MSEQDVDNYKQIKTDLDQLRLTVEKSELWVEKSGVYSSEELGVRQAEEANNEVLCTVLLSVWLPFCIQILHVQLLPPSIQSVTVL